MATALLTRKREEAKAYEEAGGNVKPAKIEVTAEDIRMGKWPT